MEAVKDKSKEMTLELINYEYGYIGYCMGVDKEDEAKKYFSLAILNIDVLEKAGYKISVINAYKSAFYGFRIGFNKLSAPFNGPRSLDYAKKSLEQDRDNYLAYVQYGNAQFYMPAAFGGSKKEAMEYFLKAKAILERNQPETQGNWNYLNVMTLIGQAYTALGDYNSAKSAYEKILRFEPGFTYVRDELYPQLLKKIKK
jgi:tetratricopeptide (TPR) repeat protein